MDFAAAAARQSRLLGRYGTSGGASPNWESPGLMEKLLGARLFLERRRFTPSFDEDPGVGSSVECVSPFPEGAASVTSEGSFRNG